MKEQFCDLETSLEFKKLGFNEPCFAYYEKSEMLSDNHRLRYIEHEETNPCKNNPLNDLDIAAPLLQQSCKWFRDKYNLSIEPGIFKSGYKSCVVTITDGYFDVVIGGSKFNTWPTYEEAELEGIKKTIQYLKNEMGKSTTKS